MKNETSKMKTTKIKFLTEEYFYKSTLTKILVTFFLLIFFLVACQKNYDNSDNQSISYTLDTIISNKSTNGEIGTDYIYVINAEIIEKSKIAARLSEIEKSNLISIKVYDKEQAVLNFGEVAIDGAISIDYYIDDLLLPKYYFDTRIDCSCNSSDYLCRCPLVVIDGKILKGPEIKSKLDHLSNDSIKRITVFKGDSAIAQYGQLGINGVVLIETYNNK